MIVPKNVIVVGIVALLGQLADASTNITYDKGAKPFIRNTVWPLWDSHYYYYRRDFLRTIAQLPLKLLFFPMQLANWFAGYHLVQHGWFSTQWRESWSSGSFGGSLDYRHVARRCVTPNVEGKYGGYGNDKWYFGAGLLATVAWIGIPVYLIGWENIKSWPAKLWARLTGKPCVDSETPDAADKEAEADPEKSDTDESESTRAVQNSPVSETPDVRHGPTGLQTPRTEFKMDPRVIGLVLVVVVIAAVAMFLSQSRKAVPASSEPDLEKGEGGGYVEQSV